MTPSDVNPAAFYQPQRQSPVAILLILFRLLKALLRQAWPLAVVLFINPKSGFWAYIIYFAIVAAVGTAVLSILSYFKFFFYIRDEELVIEKGILQKTKLNIPFDRIQTINFQQNLIHQVFNVISLEVDTAGSSQKEFAISALEKDQAEFIRSYVMAQKKQQEPPSEITEAIEEEESSRPDQLIFKLTPQDLLKVGLGRNHLRTLGIIIATIFGLFQYLEEAMGQKRTIQLLGDYFGVQLSSIFSTILFLLPFFLLAAVLLTLVNTVLQYFDLRFFRTTQGFKTIAGLFTRREQSTSLQKIQWVRWSTNPLMRLFKQYRLQLAAASSAQVGRQQAMSVPGCYQAQIEAVRQSYFPAFAQQERESSGISKAIISRHLLYFGLPPFLAGPFITGGLGPFDLLWLGWIPLVYFLSHRFWKKWRFHISADGLQTDKGIFGSQATLLQWYKVQAIDIRQTPYQRRKQLATIHFFTAAGSVIIPYIPLADAQTLRNFVLYKVESDPRKWM
ncbi:MAG: PH domain-containing protein [Bacteroidota bacterium]